MTSFWMTAFFLGALSAGFVLLPLFLQRSRDTVDRNRTNVGLYRERVAELEAQLADGMLTETEFSQMSTELKQSLLSDTASADLQRKSSAGVGKLPIVMALLIPGFAFFAYDDFGLSWGALTDLEVSQELKSTSIGDAHDEESLRATIDKLAKSLERQPDNYEGWYMLAQSYLKLSEFGKAADAFARLAHQFPEDAGLASYYAEALFLADDRKITPRVDKAVENTLALNPHDITMLEIQGMAAFLKGDLEDAHENFSRALITAESERAELIRRALVRVEAQMGGAASSIGSTSASADLNHDPAANDKLKAPAGRIIQVLVELADRLDADINASVFVFARAVSGPPMPLAVKRMTVRELPTLVRLDESMAMMQGMGLANFDTVQVVARISSTGIAKVSPDDFEAVSGDIDLTQSVPVIKLKIEKRVIDL